MIYYKKHNSLSLKSKSSPFSSSILLATIILLLFNSCGNKFVRNAEARDDEREMQLALEANYKILNSVIASVETDPVYSDNIHDDTADDPAIWYNKNDPEQSLIFGSNKKHGIHSYNLDGKELQYISCGTVNNIDIRNDVLFANSTKDVLAGSHRMKNSIVIFMLDNNGKISSTPDYEISLSEFDPYGFCLYQSVQGKLFALVNNKHGMIYQVSIDINAHDQLVSEVVQNYKLKTQVEGMVVNDSRGILYVGEEQTGIYKINLLSKSKSKPILINESTNANSNIRYDIEGLALINDDYLVASSQGNFSYAVFDLKEGKYLNSFKIGEGKFDGVEETDGIEISTLAFGDKFPNGILVVQDGFNFDGKEKKSQNFKIVDFREVLSKMRL